MKCSLSLKFVVLLLFSSCNSSNKEQHEYTMIAEEISSKDKILNNNKVESFLDSTIEIDVLPNGAIDDNIVENNVTEKIIFNSYKHLDGVVRQYRIVLYSDYTIKIFTTKWDLNFNESEGFVVDNEFYPIRHEIKRDANNGIESILIACSTNARNADKLYHQHTAIFSIKDSFVVFKSVFGTGGSDMDFNNLEYINYPSNTTQFEGVGYVVNNF